MGGKGRRWRNKRRALSSPATITCTSLKSQSVDPRFVRLRQWMKMHRFQGPRKAILLEPAEFEGTGRGMKATCHLQANEVIISVPKKLLMTTRTVLASYLGPLISSWTPPLSPLKVLCIYLACERFRGPASFWAPYIDVLPETYTNAINWKKEDLQLLPEDILADAYKQTVVVEDNFKALQPIIDELEKAHPEVQGAMTFDTFKWAWSTVNTRSVYLKQPCHPSLASAEEDHYALAPYLDLLNHSAHAEVEAGFNARNQCYEIRTLTPYPKHSQVFISYGPHDNKRLLLEYGFVLPQNQHDVVCLTLEDLTFLGEAFNLHQIRKKLRIISEHNLHRSLVCGRDGPSWSLMTALRILAMDDELLTRWKVVLSGQLLPADGEDQVQALARHLYTTSAHSLSTLPQVPVQQRTYPQLMAARLREDRLSILENSLRCLEAG